MHNNLLSDNLLSFYSTNVPNLLSILLMYY